MKIQFPLAAYFMSLVLVTAGPYDPMAVPDSKVVSEKMEVRDDARERVLPLRIYLPEKRDAAPLILFSHGLGGSCDSNPYLGEHWAGRGYVVVFVQHPGSDESVWKNTSPLKRIGAMKKAASLGNFTMRVEDIPAVIDALTLWNAQKEHPLFGRLDLEHIGMSGHSFGAKTSQAIAGQKFFGETAFLEKRLDASLMMSPSPPNRGDLGATFEAIEIPCMLMTGTLDESKIGGTTAEDRLKVFPYLENAPAWQVVFEGAEHSSFGQRKGNQIGRFHSAILALSTAFWDAQLKGDDKAKKWLNGEGAKQTLDDKDVWEINPMGRR